MDKKEKQYMRVKESGKRNNEESKKSRRVSFLFLLFLLPCPSFPFRTLPFYSHNFPLSSLQPSTIDPLPLLPPSLPLSLLFTFHPHPSSLPPKCTFLIHFKPRPFLLPFSLLPLILPPPPLSPLTPLPPPPPTPPTCKTH